MDNSIDEVGFVAVADERAEILIGIWLEQFQYASHGAVSQFFVRAQRSALLSLLIEASQSHGD